MADDVVPLRKPEIIATFGGQVDESRVTLAVYGDDLDPSTVSAYLGCAPTESHRRGDRKGPRSPEFKRGAWFLTVEGRAPVGPGDLLRTLLERFPREPEFWQQLAARHEVQLRVGIHTAGWNRGFAFASEALALAARTGATMNFDLYFYGDEQDDV